MRNTLVLMLFVLCFLACNKSKKTKNQVPNIIVINVDDMGWKDVGFMGSAYYETPHIDYLASLGMVFTNGYASASNCAPSRACLMTGQWTPRHGVYTVSPSTRGKTETRKLIPTKNTHTLAPSHKILPKVLQAHGYQTCHAGKWHLSNDPLTYGFDVNIGGGHNGLPRSYYPPYKNVKIKGGSDKYLTDAIMEKAIHFVDTVQKPFYLNYSPYAVHVPIMAVDSIVPKYENKKPWKGQGNAKYASMVDNLDRNIGLLTKKLKEKNLFDKTLIVFTSDNGGLYGITKQKPLRAGKGSYYEGGIRVPFFFTYKNKIGASVKNNTPITNLDIYPTLLEYAGIKAPTLKLDGQSLKPVLEAQEFNLDRALYWHFPIYLEAYNVNDNENRDALFRTRPGTVIRKGNWKLHYYYEDKAVELYNLADDIGEKNNLAEANPEQAEALLKILKQWCKTTNAPVLNTLNPEYVKDI